MNRFSRRTVLKATGSASLALVCSGLVGTLLPSAARATRRMVDVTRFDHDGDGRTDIAVWRPSEGSWYMVDSSTSDVSHPTIQQLGVAGDIPVPGDYDGDGKTDLAVWRASEGNWYIVGSSRSDVSRPIVRQLGAAGDIPVPGDYDGDGRTDLAVWRPNTGTWWIVRSSDGAIYTRQWGTAGDVPVPRDYDGDGKTDLAVWRPGSGTWWIVRSSDSNRVSSQWGAAGDIPVPGDYDGDGRADLAVWRPGTGTWWIVRSSDGIALDRQWGAIGDIPVPADYDRDGRTDTAVWRPDTGTWRVTRSSDGGQVVQQWGAVGDRPLAEPTALPAWVPRFGLVDDSQLISGDILVFVPNDPVEASIDAVTGSYGYSHCGLVCGSHLYEVDNTNQRTVPPVEAVDLAPALRRRHIACRLGLTSAQSQALCAAVTSQVGKPMAWLELATFGNLHVPGREISTMLVMHGLDSIGVDRSPLGLAGFVSPNGIARDFRAPRGH